MKKAQEKESVPLLLGNGLEHLMNILYDKGDFKMLLGLVPGMSCKDVLAILEQRAHIEGDNLSGFHIVFDDEGQEEEDG